MGECRLESIRIEISEGLSVLIWEERVKTPDREFDVLESPGPPLYFTARSYRGTDQIAPIVYNPNNPAGGCQALIFFENTTYQWKLFGPIAADLGSNEIRSPLRSPGKAVWRTTSLSDEALRGHFRVTNYLGTAEIVFASLLSPLRFEIQSRKLDYQNEYRAMVEAIAHECQQLLLEWDSPTAFNFTSDSEREKEILLEQFLFLRHVLGGERLDLYLEEIRRNPHTALLSERNWKPSAIADSRLFMRDTLRHGRDWQRTAGGFFPCGNAGPAEIMSERRHESFDTPPNRFVLLAIGAFREICERVLEAFSEQKGTAWMEASEMRDVLDAFCANPFFDDVGQLRRLPLESQTLQKREGYREILTAWLMLEAAAKLDWPGRQDAYDGTNRNAAKLYEFWLYFVLRRLLIGSLKMKELSATSEADGVKPFIDRSSGKGLQINLRGGLPSLSRFVWTSPSGEELGVHFFYERYYSRSKSPTVGGTYSLPFNPDFTLAFFPAEYLRAGKWHKAESEAESTGRIGYLHFDAKYRIELLKDLFGDGSDEEVRKEKEDSKATGTFKRADVYKMHTYNDAIRRTAGSYILYPGHDARPSKKFLRYEEVAPGVGAFCVRPSPDAEGEEQKPYTDLSNFIKDVLSHHVDQFSRHYRIRHWTHRTLNETPGSNHRSRIAPVGLSGPADDALCLFGYVRPDDENFFREQAVFYFHAVDKKGRPELKNSHVFQAQYFIGFNRQKTLSWIGKIKESRLASAEELRNLPGREDKPLSVPFYYLFELDQIFSFETQDIAHLALRKRGRPLVRSFSALYPSLS